MKVLFLLWPLLLALNVQASNLLADLRIQFGSDSISTGEPFDLQLIVEHDPDLSISWIEPDPAALYPLVLLDSGVVDTLAADRLQKTWSAAVYKPGLQYFAPLRIELALEDEPLVLESDSLQVQVYSVLQAAVANGDSVTIEDILDPRAIPRTWRDYIIWGLAALLLLLLAFLVYRFYAGKSERPAGQPRIVPVDPWEHFEKTLAKIAREQRWKNGETVDYYADLSLCMRGLLEDWLNLPFREMTQDEVLAALPNSPLNTESAAQLLGLLRESDLVLYARHFPEDHRNGEFLAEVRQWSQGLKSFVAASQDVNAGGST